MTKDKKIKLKQRFIKVVNVICYVLSICFIGLLTIAGLQSCKSAEGNSAETYNPELEYRYVYTPYFEDSPTILSGQAFLQWSYENLNGYEPSGNPEYFDRYCFTNNTYLQVVISNDIYGANNIRLRYQRLDDVGVIPAPYGLVEVSLVRYTSSNYYKVTELYVAVIGDGGVQLNHGDFKVYCNINNVQYPYLFVTDEIDTSKRFIFNEDFNYNAPVTLSRNTQYIDTSNFHLNDGWSLTDESTVGYHEYCEYMFDMPEFISGNQTFDAICWVVDASDAVLYVNPNNLNDYYAGPLGSHTYARLYYYNSREENYVLVNTRNIYTGYSNTFSKPYEAYMESTTWTNVEYRYLTFLESPNDSVRGMLLAFNNNNQFYDGGLYDTSDVNVFTLIGGAFASWVPIFGISLLPSITIGMLLVVPLIVTIVLFIVKLLRK